MGGKMKYYVDSEDGNDKNDGLSPATAWKTVAELNARGVRYGDEILLSATNFKHAEIDVDGITIGSMSDAEVRIVIDGWREEKRKLMGIGSLGLEKDYD